MLNWSENKKPKHSQTTNIHQIYIFKGYAAGWMGHCDGKKEKN